MKILPFAILWITLNSCSNNTVRDEAQSTTTYQIVNDLSYNDLIDQIGEDRLEQGVEPPDSDGALGRNKDGYFHVRFQLNMTALSDFTVVAERMDALQHLRNTITYSFDRQLEDGSFLFSPPEELVNEPEIPPATPGDLASGTAFFASSLGLSLGSLEDSDWFQNNAETQAIKNEIESLKPSFEKTLDYLLREQDVLRQYDAGAPNRLLFDALAYYSLGKYLSRSDAQQTGLEFMELALNLIDTIQGYFIEGGGWDSSYNGVAIKLAMELYAIMDESTQKDKLGTAIIDATVWQMSRISETGKVSTEGNTRVYDGGETFLGVEKSIDYVKIVKALYYFGGLTNSLDIIELGDVVLDYYH